MLELTFSPFHSPHHFFYIGSLEWWAYKTKDKKSIIFAKCFSLTWILLPFLCIFMLTPYESSCQWKLKRWVMVLFLVSMPTGGQWWSCWEKDAVAWDSAVCDESDVQLFNIFLFLCFFSPFSIEVSEGFKAFLHPPPPNHTHQPPPPIYTANIFLSHFKILL